MHIWKSYISSNKLDLQETNICFTQLNRAEIISLDAGLRMDGIPAVDLWDFVIEVFHSSPNKLKKSKGRVQGNLLRDTPSNKHTHKPDQGSNPARHSGIL